MGDRLRGRVALVTGAGRGIGRGVAMLMAEEGASVVVADFGGNVDGSGTSTGPADDVVAEIKAAGGTAIADYSDVSTYAGAGHMVQTALDNYGRLDVLCHVAGVLRDRMVFNMTEEEWDIVLAVHLKGAFNTVRNALTPMLEQRYGRILLFSSGAGLGNSGQANYSSAKEGMVGFSRALARELGPYGIAVNTIYPGGNTRMTQSIPDSTSQIRAAAGIGVAGAAGAPRGAAPPPNLMATERMNALNNAPPVTWLASEAGGMVSGQVIGTSGWQASRYSIRQVIRSLSSSRRWTVEELTDAVPNHLAQGIPNPAPNVQAKES